MLPSSLSTMFSTKSDGSLNIENNNNTGTSENISCDPTNETSEQPYPSPDSSLPPWVLTRGAQACLASIGNDENKEKSPGMYPASFTIPSPCDSTGSVSCSPFLNSYSPFLFSYTPEFTPPGEGHQNLLHGKRAYSSDSPCSGLQRKNGPSSLPQNNLEKGNAVYRNVLERQKKLFNLHKDEKLGSSRRSPLIHPPHWSPTVPSSSPIFASPKSSAKSLPSNQHGTVRESLPHGVESQNSPIIEAKVNIQSSLQIQDASPIEMELAYLLTNIGDDNNAGHHTKQDLESRTAAAMPPVSELTEGKVHPKRQKRKSPEGLRGKNSSNKNSFKGDGMEAASDGSPKRKEAAVLTEADIASTLELGEEDLDLLAMNEDDQITRYIQTKKITCNELDRVLAHLLDINGRLNSQTRVYNYVIEMKKNAQKISDTKLIEWTSMRNCTLRSAISFMTETQKKIFADKDASGNIDETLALKLLQICRLLVFGEDDEMVKSFCADPDMPIKLYNVEQVIDDLKGVAGPQPWYTGL